MQNIGYVSSWRTGDVQKPFLVKNAPLLIRFLLAGIFSGLVYFFRKKLPRPFILASLWLVLALLAVTLSERPYPHYLLQAAAPISLLAAIFLAEKGLVRFLAIFPLTLAFLVPVVFKFWHYSTLAYYQHFAELAIGKISKEQYFSTFNPRVDRNYQIARFLVSSARPQDKIFVWSQDSPTIYALSRRLPPLKYVAPYHITDFADKESVANSLTQSQPKFIILTTDSGPLPQIYPLLRKNYLLVNRFAGAEIWSLIEHEQNRR